MHVWHIHKEGFWSISHLILVWYIIDEIKTIEVVKIFKFI